jgi:DNA replication licensing factor MCM2
MRRLHGQVAKEVVLSKYEDYGSIQQEIHVRVVNLPVVDSLRDLRHVHLGVFIKV